MRKFSLKSVFGIALISLFLVSCSKSPEQIKFIPKDAHMVLAVDVKSIGTKSADFKDLVSLENLKKMFTEGTKEEKIRNSGIDFMNTAYVFGNALDEKSEYWAIILPLSDDAKYEEFVKGLEKGFTVASEGDYKIATSEKANDPGKVRIIAWNKTASIILEQNQGATVSPKDKVLSFFNLKKEESLAENDKNFAELQKKSADISLWLSFESLHKKVAAINPATAGLNLKETYLTATCTFEKGQILVDANYHPNKEGTEILALGKDGLSQDVVNALNGKSVIGMMGFALDMTKVYAYLEKEKMVAGIDETAKQVGMTGKDLFQLLSGDFGITVNGVQMKDVKSMNWMTGAEEMRKEPRPELTIAIGINDKDKIAKLLASLVEKGALVKQDKYYTVQDKFLEGYFIVDKGNCLVIAGPEILREATVNGTTEKLNSELSSTLTSNSSSLYFNLAAVPDQALDMAFGMKEQIKNSPIESILITSSSLKENTSTGKAVVVFKDKEQNSLVTLAKMSDDLSKEEKAPLPVEPMVQDSVNVEEEVEEPAQ